MSNGSRSALPLPDAALHARIEQRVLPLLQNRRRKSDIRVALVVVVGVVMLFGTLSVVYRPRLPQTRELFQAPAAAVLEKKSMPELLAMREQMIRMGPQISASHVFVPVSARVEASDLFVEGIVETIDYDRDSLIKQIIAATPGPLYGTITLRVIESYPPINDDSITVPGNIGAGFGVGKRYLIPLQRQGDEFFHEFSFGTPPDYQIQETDGQADVFGLTVNQHRMPMEEAWELIRSLFDSIHGSGIDSPANLLDRLKNQSTAEATLALEILSSTSPAAYSDMDLVEALETHHARIMGDRQSPVEGDGTLEIPRYELERQFQTMAMPVLQLLYPIASDSAVQRTIDLYVNDHATSITQAFDSQEIESEMLRLALKYPGGGREHRVRSVVGQIGGEPRHDMLMLIAQTPGEDMDRLLREIFHLPAQYQLSPDYTVVSPEARFSHQDCFLLRAQSLAANDVDSQGSLQVLIDMYSAGQRNLLGAIVLRSRDGDVSPILPLLEGAQGWAVAAAVALKSPDPALLPVLREAADDEYWDVHPVAGAINACGAPDEALALAEEVLAAAVPATWSELLRDARMRTGALLALGEIGGERAESLLREWIGPEAESYGAAEDAAKKSNNSSDVVSYSAALNVRLAAGLALTRLGAADAIDIWRTLWGTGGPQERMTAAMALYSLGDDTGREYVEAFVPGREKRIQELHRHLNTQGWTREFQNTIRYLRTPTLHALYLQRIQHVLGQDDAGLLCDPAFELEHAATVLPLLVQHLQSRDGESRQIANGCLESLLGMDVEWNDEMLAGTQPEKVERWSHHVEDFLATFVPARAANTNPEA